MKNVAACSGALLLSLLVFGCGGPGPEKEISKEIDAANDEYIEEVRKASGVDAVMELAARCEARKAKALARLEQLSPERRKTATATINKATEASRERQEQAAEEAPRLLRKGPNPLVLMETSLGPIRLELYERAAPRTVENFLRYVDEKFYDGTIFHRVMSDFMIQGGGLEPGLKEKPTHKPIGNEAYNGLSNLRGTVAMARTSDRDSATAQFFINLKNNYQLNREYAVFGEVTEGMDVVDKIRSVAVRDRGDYEKVPVEDVVIKSVRRVEKK